MLHGRNGNNMSILYSECKSVINIVFYYQRCILNKRFRKVKTNAKLNNTDGNFWYNRFLLQTKRNHSWINFYNNKIKDLWQSWVKQVYWHHFFSSICSFGFKLILVKLTVFQIVALLLYLLWWPVTHDLWCYLCHCHFIFFK